MPERLGISGKRALFRSTGEIETHKSSPGHQEIAGQIESGRFLIRPDLQEIYNKYKTPTLTHNFPENVRSGRFFKWTGVEVSIQRVHSGAARGNVYLSAELDPESAEYTQGMTDAIVRLTEHHLKNRPGSPSESE